MGDRDDWRWQLANRITSVDELSTYVDLTSEEAAGIQAAGRRFTWSVTPYYAGLMDRGDRSCPIRRQAVPSAEELDDALGVADPLAEGASSPVKLVFRVYPDRVAFTVANRCPVYCRHCLRKQTVCNRAERDCSADRIEEGITYIHEHAEVRDVLLTGGDPLVLSDERIEDIVRRVRAIPTVEVIRIGTRSPCTLPQRITPGLCDMLSRYHPLYINTQFNHPKEITPEAGAACARLARAGIPLGNQSVLLRGINDDVATMKKLCCELMRIRVRPYYLFQCQMVAGTRHFRTPLERGIEILENIEGHTSGLAVPKFVLDTPHGKVPVGPSYLLGRRDDEVVLRTWNGMLWRERNPAPEAGK